jgi:transposase
MITSMPGLGVIICAEFLASAGDDMTVLGAADRLAAFGVAPCPVIPGTAQDRVAEDVRGRAAAPGIVFQLIHVVTGPGAADLSQPTASTYAARLPSEEAIPAS